MTGLLQGLLHGDPQGQPTTRFGPCGQQNQPQPNLQYGQVNLARRPQSTPGNLGSPVITNVMASAPIQDTYREQPWSISQLEAWQPPFSSGLAPNYTRGTIDKSRWVAKLHWFSLSTRLSIGYIYSDITTGDISTISTIYTKAYWTSDSTPNLRNVLRCQLFY